MSKLLNFQKIKRFPCTVDLCRALAAPQKRSVQQESDSAQNGSYARGSCGKPKSFMPNRGEKLSAIVFACKKKDHTSHGMISGTFFVCRYQPRH